MYDLASKNSAHIEKLRDEKGIDQYKNLLNSSKKFNKFCEQSFLDDKQAKEFKEALERDKKLESEDPKKLSEKASETIKNNKLLSAFIGLAAFATVAIPISETGVGGGFPNLSIGSNLFTSLMSWALIAAAVAGVGVLAWNKGEKYLNDKDKEKSENKVKELAEEIAKQKEKHLDNFNFLDNLPLNDILAQEQMDKFNKAADEFSKSEDLNDSDLAKRYLLNYLSQESIEGGKIDADKFRKKVDGLDLNFNLNREVNDALVRTLTGTDIKALIETVGGFKLNQVAIGAKEFGDSLRSKVPPAASQGLSPAKLEKGDDFSVDESTLSEESMQSEEYSETHSERASNSKDSKNKSR